MDLSGLVAYGDPGYEEAGHGMYSDFDSEPYEQSTEEGEDRRGSYTDFEATSAESGEVESPPTRARSRTVGSTVIIRQPEPILVDADEDSESESPEHLGRLLKSKSLKREHMRTPTNLIRGLSRAGDWSPTDLKAMEMQMKVAFERQVTDSSVFPETTSAMRSTRHHSRKSTKSVKKAGRWSHPSAKDTHKKLQTCLNTIDELNEMVASRRRRLRKLECHISERQHVAEQRDITAFMDKLQCVGDDMKDAHVSLEAWDKDTRREADEVAILRREKQMILLEKEELEARVRSLQQKVDRSLKHGRSPTPGRVEMQEPMALLHDRSGSTVYHHGTIIDEPSAMEMQMHREPMTRVQVTQLSPRAQAAMLGQMQAHEPYAAVQPLYLDQQRDELPMAGYHMAGLTQQSPGYGALTHGNVAEFQQQLEVVTDEQYYLQQPGGGFMTPSIDPGNEGVDSRRMEELKRRKSVIQTATVVLCGVLGFYIIYRLFSKTSSKKESRAVTTRVRSRSRY